MSRIFYYDKGTADADVSNGTVDVSPGETYTNTGTAITNDNLANDQNVGAALTGWVDNEAIRFDFGSSVSATYVAVYFNAPEGVNIEIYAGNSTTNMGTQIVKHEVAFITGWNIINLGGTEWGRYWFIVADGGGGLDGVCEIMVCDKWTFTNTFALGNSESVIDGIDTDRSYGNVKGTNKRFDELMTWNGTWDNVTAANKTDLKTFESAIDVTRLKFIYDDDSTLWWVSKTNRFVFVETAYQHYTLGINLIEEIE